MATLKPTSAEVRLAYSKLDDDDLMVKIDRGLAWGWNYVLEQLACIYPVTGWATDCPPAVYDMTIQLAYAYASGEAVHTGKSLSASDDMATKVFEAVEKRLSDYKSEGVPLLDDTGARIAQRASSASWRRQRTTAPVFTMDDEETQTVDVPTVGQEWS